MKSHMAMPNLFFLCEIVSYWHWDKNTRILEYKKASWLRLGLRFGISTNSRYKT